MQTTILLLPAEITQANAPATLSSLSTELQSAVLANSHVNACANHTSTNAECGVVMVDAAQLKQFDSSVLAVLMAVRRIAHQNKRKWQVQNANEQLTRLADVYGVKRLLFTPEM